MKSIFQIHWLISQIFVFGSIILFTLATLPQMTGKKCVYSDDGEICQFIKIIQSLKKLANLDFHEMTPIFWVYLADFVCFFFFAIEMVVKLLTCPYPLKFLQSPSGLIEVLVLFPDFISMLLILLSAKYYNDKRSLGLDFDISMANTFRLFRILRLFRIFRLIKRTPQFMIIVYSIWASITDLLTVGVFIVSASTFFASLLHFIPSEKEHHFKDIPTGIWFGIITMTTVGYGDIIPVSIGGKSLSIICAVCGVLLLGISAPTLVHNFLTYFNLLRYMEEKENQFMKDMKKYDDLNKRVTYDIDFSF